MYRVTMHVRHGDVDTKIARVGETIADALADVLGSNDYGVGYGPTTVSGQEMVRATLEDEGSAEHGWADYTAERS